MALEVTQQNAAALEPLFKSWEKPTRYRTPDPEWGQTVFGD